MALLQMLPRPEEPQSKPELEIRPLTPEEIAQVEPIFKDRGEGLPDPAISTFVGIVKDGRVVGFQVIQLRLHVEPTWIEDGHSHLFESLCHASERVILQKCGPQWVYVFTPAGRLSTLAQKMGMQMEPWVIHSKLVQPELPPKGVIQFLSQEEPDELRPEQRDPAGPAEPSAD